jgi:predicted flap endonuclease-1-like 5' DNA nuclease
MSRFARTFGFFSLGLGITLLIGYWMRQEELRNRRLITPTTPAKPQDADTIVLSKKTLDAASPAPSPVTTKATKPADDLTLIKGIGAKTAEILQEAGISTYAALSSTSADDLLEKLQGKVRGLTTEKLSAWIQQAAELKS